MKAPVIASIFALALIGAFASESEAREDARADAAAPPRKPASAPASASSPNPASIKPASAKPAAAKPASAMPAPAKPSAKPASKPVTAAAGAPLQLHAPAKSAKASAPAARPGGDQIAALIERHAIQHGVPSALAHRVVMRESRYNPAARNRAYWGLMQIRHDTARSLGYSGAPEGLLDPDVNLRYGMAYLGNAYRVAGGDQSHAVALYSRGYYFEAKRKGMLGQLRKADSAPVAEANAR